MSNYSITIQLNNDTVTQLKQNGFYLYAFKSVVGNSGAPVVWIKYDTFLNNHVINWSSSYQGYVGTLTTVNNTTTVTASTQMDVSLGDLWSVDNDGVSTIATNGPASAVTFQSNFTSKLNCGLSYLDPVTKLFNPVCTFPLFGSGIFTQITPVEKVALLFATDVINTGTVIEQSFSTGMLIDLTTSHDQQLAFDIQTGWNAPATRDFLPITANASLSKLLNGGGPSNFLKLSRAGQSLLPSPYADMSLSFSMKKGDSEFKAELSAANYEDLPQVMSALAQNLMMLSSDKKPSSSNALKIKQG